MTPISPSRVPSRRARQGRALTDPITYDVLIRIDHRVASAMHLASQPCGGDWVSVWLWASSSSPRIQEAQQSWMRPGLRPPQTPTAARSRISLRIASTTALEALPVRDLLSFRSRRQHRAPLRIKRSRSDSRGSPLARPTSWRSRRWIPVAWRAPAHRSRAPPRESRFR